LRARVIARDREMLISSPNRGMPPLEPMRLSACRPLKLVVPSRRNTRRRNLDAYMVANGIVVDELLEMDAMMGSREFVSVSDWMTIVPALICRNDARGGPFIVNPLADPPLHVDFVLIEPSRKPLSLQAQLFVARLEQEVAHIERDWQQILVNSRSIAV
jgi:DNA-binding transcriptional LysR family regulator